MPSIALPDKSILWACGRVLKSDKQAKKCAGHQLDKNELVDSKIGYKQDKNNRITNYNELKSSGDDKIMECVDP